MKKLFSAVLTLCTSLLFGLLLTGCSFFDFEGDDTEHYPVACACWNDADGVVTPDEMVNQDRYSIEAVKEHSEEAVGSYTDGSYILKCNKCTWTAKYDGVLHRDFQKKTVIGKDCEKDTLEVEYCKYCNFVKAETPVNKSHDEVHLRTQQPTCTENGGEIYECRDCKKQRIEIIPATGHKTKTTHDAELGNDFCLDGGYEVETCTVCKQVISKTPVAPGHTILMEKVNNDPTITEDMIGWTLEPAPTATKTGTLTGYCVKCEKMVNITVPAWNSTNYNADVNCKEHTITYTISVDNHGKFYPKKPANTAVVEYVFVDENATTYHTLNGKPATANRYLATTKGIREFIDDNATCTQEGYGYYVCENPHCGESVDVITYLNHSFGGATVFTYEGQEPTCGKAGKGYSLSYCTLCNAEKRTENVTVPATGKHSFNGECTPEIKYNPETKKWTATLKVLCTTCNTNNPASQYQNTRIKITEAQDPTCENYGWAYYEYTDHNGNKIQDHVIADGYGHREGATETWTWLDKTTGYTHTYTGFTCKDCDIRFYHKEVVTNAAGTIINTYVYEAPKQYVSIS